MIFVIALWCFFFACRAVGEIVITTSGAEEDGQGDCLQLVTCTASPILGNLFWFATFANGSELRFARNDGGNAERNPPYNEITLNGITNFYTEVSRELINGDLFTEFNSTLAFNVFHWLQYNSSISCGSLTTNSSKITPPVPQIVDEGDYHLTEVINSIGRTLECIGSNIPFNRMVGNCLINTTTNLLWWSINGRTVVQYSYVMGSLKNVSEYSDEYIFNTTNLEPQNYKLNVMSRLQVISDLPPGTSVSCGSNFIRSNLLTISNDVTETREQLNVTSSPCLTSITCHTVSSGTCDVTLNGSNIGMTTVSGPVNSIINLPSELQGSASIEYMAKFNSFIIDRGNFTGNYPARLSSENAALMAIGVLLCFLSLILLVFEAAVILKKVTITDKLKLIFVLTTAIWLFIVSIDVILWITTAAIVAPREDTCDEEWQKSRDGLVIAAFVLALISLLPSLQLLLVFYNKKDKGYSKRWSEIEARKQVLGLEGDLSDTKVDSLGRTPYENLLSTGGHRLFGESTGNAHNRVSEEVSNIAKIEVKAKEEQSRQIASNNYDSLNQVGSKHNIESNQQAKAIPTDTQMYSFLDRRKPGKNSVAPDNSDEYSGLKHNTGAQGPAATNFQGRAVIDRRQNVTRVEEQYGQLDPSQMGESASPNLNPRGGGQGSGDNF